MQAVAAAGGPAGDHADDDLGHEADQPLALEDVQAASLALSIGFGVGAGVVVPVGLVLVAGLAADPLVAAGAEGPLAVLRAGAVAGEEHAADVGGRARVLQDAQQLVDGVRPERVEHVGPVEGDPDRAVLAGPVVGQVGQVLEAGDRRPSASGSKISRTPSIALMARRLSAARNRAAAAVVLWRGMTLNGNL